MDLTTVKKFDQEPIPTLLFDRKQVHDLILLLLESDRRVPPAFALKDAADALSQLMVDYDAMRENRDKWIEEASYWLGYAYDKAEKEEQVGKTT